MVAIIERENILYILLTKRCNMTQFIDCIFTLLASKCYRSRSRSAEDYNFHMIFSGLERRHFTRNELNNWLVNNVEKPYTISVVFYFLSVDLVQPRLHSSHMLLNPKLFTNYAGKFINILWSLSVCNNNFDDVN